MALKVEIEKKWNQENEMVTSWCGGKWSVTDLISKTKELPTERIALAHMDLSGMGFECRDLVEFCQHMKHVEECDFEQPIILDSKGCVLDGRHRICKALMKGHLYILAKRLPTYMIPTIYDDQS